MIAPITYVVDLDQLDKTGASFVHLDPSGGPSLARLALQREQWQDLGRPTRLYVRVTDKATDA